jgi:hypothetical protein
MSNNRNNIIKWGILTIMAMVGNLSMTGQTADTDSVADAPLTARALFMDISEQNMPMLTHAVRMDMLDYYDAGLKDKWVSNTFDGSSQIILLTDDYLKAEITEVSTLELKILPLGKGKRMAAEVYTLRKKGIAGDSGIRFRNDKRRYVNDDSYFLRAPQLKDFILIPKGSEVNAKEIEAVIPFLAVVYELNPDNTSLAASISLEDYLSKEDYTFVKPYIVPTLHYEWTGSKYKLIKSKGKN